MTKLTATFWGVRGSVPAPGPNTGRYGGNTACVEVRAGDQLFVFDMGTGIRALGEAISGRTRRGTIFISHYHWDHIQGLPFFGPAYDPRCSFEIYGAVREGRGVEELLAGQMVPPYFPVPLHVLRARLGYHSIASGEAVQFGDVRVTARELNHPNGVLGYRLDYAGHSLVYATDTEHGSAADDALVEFARGASGLVYDAMFTPAEYEGPSGPSKAGWGHSTWRAAVEIVRRAGVKKLALFHHDPARSDAALDEILKTAAAVHADTVVAREGETIGL